MSRGRAPDLPAEGLRARKRRDTHRRIVDEGVRLFLAKGIAATTLDEIAAAAGISRRSYFSYFRSKDDILVSLQSGLGAEIVQGFQQRPPEEPPLQSVCEAVVAVCAPYSTDWMVAMDRLMRSSATVQARKQASYIEHERTLLAALRQRWPAPEWELPCRLIAMMALGAMRLAFERFNAEEGARPVATLLRETFAALDETLCHPPAVPAPETRAPAPAAVAN